MGNQLNKKKKKRGWQKKKNQHLVQVLREQWLSCQTDVNKLVQRNGNELSESVRPENGHTVVGDSPPDEGVDIKDIITPIDVIDEVFTLEEKTVVKTEDDDKKELLSTEWVIHKFLCRCCHAEGDFTSFLTETHEDNSYEDLLQTCFNIQLLSVEGYAGAGALRALCGLCVARLQDACDFKRQVKAAEERFQELFNGSCIEVACAIDVKEEEPNDTDDVGLRANEVTPDELRVEDDSKLKKLKVEQKQQTVKPKPRKKIKNPKKGQRPKITYEYFTIVDDRYKCTKCEKTYQNRNYATAHFKRVHLKIRRYIKCDVPLCEEKFQSKCQRTLHKLEKHNIDERYKCNACDKYFNLKQQLINHEKSYHMLGEVIKCTICDFQCYTNRVILAHMFKHKSSKDFQCKYCKKAFLRRRTLNFHERIHTGDKRKECMECGEKFVQKASLNYHMAKHHPGVRF